MGIVNTCICRWVELIICGSRGSDRHTVVTVEDGCQKYRRISVDLGGKRGVGDKRYRVEYM